jgi:hypothetical protein
MSVPPNFGGKRLRNYLYFLPQVEVPSYASENEYNRNNDIFENRLSDDGKIAKADYLRNYK